jgi:hypothetical protein
MSLKAGDSFPSGIFRIKDQEGLKEISTEEYFKSSKGSFICFARRIYTNMFSKTFTWFY